MTTHTENADFLEYAYRRVWLAAGADSEHANVVARVVSHGDRIGKLNQGMGVFEVLHVALEAGALDIAAKPLVVDDGPTWAVVDGRRSSGQLTLTKMAEVAIEKAREHGIAIVFGGNHNDAGCFAAYTELAHREDMVAQTSNNSVRLAAPFGGMENVLSCPPFDAIIPSGSRPPIAPSVTLGELHDGDVSEAFFLKKRLKGDWAIDRETGAVTDDIVPYFEPLGDYGRVCGYSCAGRIAHPRTYALNLWNEGMTAIINPIGIPSNEMGEPSDYSEANSAPSVGGSYFLCIDPSHFGPISDVKAKSDAYVESILSSRALPGESIRMPGQLGFERLKDKNPAVEVFQHHWEPFWRIAETYALTESSLRHEFESQSS
jgi:L-2-hydroxycarboxylate dehydrogenase (NAD+)